MTGKCPECQGRKVTLDPAEDKGLYSIFGPSMDEHHIGCSQYPEMEEITEIEL